MLSRLDKVSEEPTRYRITCECGRFTHEIFADETGEKLRMESFAIRKPDDEPDETKAPAPKKKAGFSKLFSPEKVR